MCQDDERSVAWMVHPLTCVFSSRALVGASFWAEVALDKDISAIITSADSISNDVNNASLQVSAPPPFVSALWPATVLHF